MAVTNILYRGHNLRVVAKHGGAFTAVIDRFNDIIAADTGETFDEAAAAGKRLIDLVLSQQPLTEIVQAPGNLVPAAIGDRIPITNPPFNPSQIDAWVEMAIGDGLRLYVPSSTALP